MLQSPQGSFHYKSKTLAQSSSLQKLSEAPRQIFIAAPSMSSLNVKPPRVPAPRSATLVDPRASSVGNRLSVPNGSGGGGTKSPRVPSARGMTSTFAHAEMEKAIRFTKEQVQEFEQIKGMKDLKVKRGLKIDAGGGDSRIENGTEEEKRETGERNSVGPIPYATENGSSNRNMTKGKLKPIDKLQHFAVTTPVVTKGKHKFFK